VRAVLGLGGDAPLPTYDKLKVTSFTDGLADWSDYVVTTKKGLIGKEFPNQVDRDALKARIDAEEQ